MYIPIKDYENYSINEQGLIINTKRNKPMKNWISGEGYLCIELWKSNIGKTFLVHRLVAQTFIPNPENKPIGIQ